jgi:SNF2 family DNA or RNA helicase
MWINENCTLWEHQAHYGDKLLRGEICALFFSPRCGKTLTAIHGSRDGDRLIVCPVSVKGTWKRDLELYGETDIFIWDKYKKPKNRPKNVIVNYETLWRTDLLDYGYDTIIFDESHKLSNIQTKLFRYCYEHLKQLCSARVILLTGTPCVESWSQLISQSIVATGSFDGSTDPWEVLRNNFTYDDAKYKWIPNTGTSALFKKVFNEMGQTMTQAEAGINTKKLYRIYPITLSDDEEKAWKEHVGEFQPEGAQFGIMAQSYASGRNCYGEITQSSKLDAVVDYVKELDRPCVILAHFTASVEYLAKRLPECALIYGKDDGAAWRDKVIQGFGTKYKYIVAQVTTVKVGLNLSASDTLVFAENNFSGEARIQAEERCTVMGKEAVEIVDFVAESELEGLGTIDMSVRDAVVNKRDFNIKLLKKKM